jgi:DNA-binding NtrC family response regulator
VPPLRDRREDIPLLARAFVDKFARAAGRPARVIAPAVMERMAAYGWPGNVRELEHVIERAVILSRGVELEVETLIGPDGEAAAPPVSGPAPSAAASPRPVARTVDEIEREHVERVLQQTDWRIEGPGGAAQRLAVHPNTLRSRLKRWGLRRPSGR